MTSTGRRGFVGIDRRWLADERLSDSALRLMLWLDSHSDEYLSALDVKRTAEEIGWSRDRVRRQLDALEELGLVTTEQVHHPRSGSRTRITLHLTQWSEHRATRQGTEAENRATRQGTTVPYGEASSVPHGEAPTTRKSIDVETHSQEPISSSPTAMALPGCEPVSFDDFYEQYPRKVGKKDARAAWAKMSEDQRRAAIDAIGQHVWMWVQEGRGTRTVPHPATWLNRESWEDEVGYVPERPTAASSTAAQRSQDVLDRARRGELRSENSMIDQMFRRNQ